MQAACKVSGLWTCLPHDKLKLFKCLFVRPNLTGLTAASKHHNPVKFWSQAGAAARMVTVLPSKRRALVSAAACRHRSKRFCQLCALREGASRRSCAMAHALASTLFSSGQGTVRIVTRATATSAHKPLFLACSSTMQEGHTMPHFSLRLVDLVGVWVLACACAVCKLTKRHCSQNFGRAIFDRATKVLYARIWVWVLQW